MNQSTRTFIENSPNMRVVAEAIGLYRSEHIAAHNNVVGSRINLSDRNASNAVVGSRLRIKLADKKGHDL